MEVAFAQRKVNLKAESVFANCFSCMLFEQLLMLLGWLLLLLLLLVLLHLLLLLLYCSRYFR